MRSITVVTGSSRGIGRHLAVHCLDQGHQVYGCSRGEGTIDHSDYKHTSLDVRDEKAVRAMFASIRRSGGRLERLVNNAGIASMNHAILTPLETLDKVLSTNTGSTFLFSREAAKLMKGNGFGRIVNFTTVAVPFRLEGEAAYVASKAAVEALTQVLAREFAPWGITVNAVGPTPVDTDLIRGVPSEKLEALVARQAIPRMGTMADVQNAVDFFLRSESDFITGQILYLGGA